jgi:hypothetical protein
VLNRSLLEGEELAPFLPLLQENITVQPTYPQEHERFIKKPQSMRIWIGYDLPWTDQDTADGALTQALGFLSDRAKKK